MPVSTATRSQTGTLHDGPPITGSDGSTMITGAANCGRSSARSRAISPGLTATAAVTAAVMPPPPPGR